MTLQHAIIILHQRSRLRFLIQTCTINELLLQVNSDEGLDTIYIFKEFPQGKVSFENWTFNLPNAKRTGPLVVQYFVDTR